MNQSKLSWYGWAMIALFLVALLPVAALTAGADAGVDQEAEARSDAVADRDAGADDIFVQVYNVADLAVFRVIPGTPDKLHPDFSILTALIKSAVDPNSWDREDEPLTRQARISPFDAKLSLVISQTRENHHKVEDLLRRLREEGKEGRQRKAVSAVRAFTDKVARDPRLLGLRGATDGRP